MNNMKIVRIPPLSILLLMKAAYSEKRGERTKKMVILNSDLAKNVLPRDASSTPLVYHY